MWIRGWSPALLKLHPSEKAERKLLGGGFLLPALPLKSQHWRTNLTLDPATSPYILNQLSQSFCFDTIEFLFLRCLNNNALRSFRLFAIGWNSLPFRWWDFFDKHHHPRIPLVLRLILIFIFWLVFWDKLGIKWCKSSSFLELKYICCGADLR